MLDHKLKQHQQNYSFYLSKWLDFDCQTRLLRALPWDPPSSIAPIPSRPDNARGNIKNHKGMCISKISEPPKDLTQKPRNLVVFTSAVSFFGCKYDKKYSQCECLKQICILNVLWCPSQL
ncbi:Hypothetical_protein [Hexamita inflata]|uniref:Hypothetical_protein n=1 Tax=Hexamita inflata TaxID=28002 RepID=A0AA86U556_9EUKA|nr:Hypothetical protein HINF_LOCUS28934 [Hexamita inflata]